MGVDALFRCDAQHLGKQSKREKTGADGKINAGGDQHQHQQRNTHGTTAGQRNRDEIAP